MLFFVPPYAKSRTTGTSPLAAFQGQLLSPLAIKALEVLFVEEVRRSTVTELEEDARQRHAEHVEDANIAAMNAVIIDWHFKRVGFQLFMEEVLVLWVARS